MRLACVLTLLAAWFVLPAVAQDEPQDRPQDRRQMRRQGQRRGDQRRGPQIGALMQRMPDQLELDDEQRAQFEDIVAEYRERMGEARQRGGEMREIFREMQAAREAGDDERVEELRAQMRERRGGGGRFMEEFFGEVEGILREDQLERLSQLRSRVMQGMQRGRNPMESLRELRDRLKLDEQQAELYDELLEDLREQGGQRRQRREELRPLMQELREAMEAGDEARAEELRAQLEQQRPGRGEMLEDFFAELEKFLRDDQKEILAQFREEMSERGERGERSRVDVRALLSAARRLKLDQDQKKQLNEIGQAALRAERELQRRDREGRAMLTAKIKGEIIAILDAEQAKQFENHLSRQGRPERPGREGARERQRERRGDRQPDDERP
ncbi:MAG TPA: Spy/CpxP family protein refolding chaperone [Phycisphaerae bacterium]|nr:Spy/CpxP family protein refolding chaperone [Phycisphaerae bacterium]